MKLPAFVGITIFAIGAALLYAGLRDWGVKQPLIMREGAPQQAQ